MPLKFTLLFLVLFQANLHMNGNDILYPINNFIPGYYISITYSHLSNKEHHKHFITEPTIFIVHQLLRVS